MTTRLATAHCKAPVNATLRFKDVEWILHPNFGAGKLAMQVEQKTLLGGSAAQWLGRLSWDPEIPNSRHVLTTRWVLIQVVHGSISRLCLEIANLFASGQLWFLKLFFSMLGDISCYSCSKNPRVNNDTFLLSFLPWRCPCKLLWF